MRKSLYVMLIALMISFLLISCSTVPSISVSRPWVRSLGDETAILPGSKIEIVSVEGETDPLLGTDKFLEETIQETIIFLLERKDVEITDNNPDFRLKLQYATTRSDLMESSSMYYSQGMSHQYLGAGSYLGRTFYGYGIAAAAAVSSVERSEVITSHRTAMRRTYIHTFSMEITDRTGVAIWKGESTIDSNSLNIEREIIPALKLLLGIFPSDRSYIPIITKVQEEKAINYYNLNIKNRWFVSPVLPYRLYFHERDFQGDQISNYVIKDVEALPAFIDLLMNAEYALPIGRKGYSKPLDVGLWSKVLLGGTYILEPGNKKVSILIELKGERDGYRVAKCWVASSNEFNNFNTGLRKWEQALRDYFDYYQK